MESITLPARAKINLTLDVRCRRDDGYHELDTLMQQIALADEVCLAPRETVQVTFAGMELPQENTVRTAALLYQKMAEEKGKPGCGAQIHVQKQIPAQAGLGGASADAAAVLRGLQQLYGALSEEELYLAAAQVGSDVPFCLHGGLCRAKGRGEILSPLPGMPLQLVITKPAQGVSTAALFGALQFPVSHPDTEAAIRALSRQDAAALGKCLANSLQLPAVNQLPEIGALVEKLHALGALGAVMTGSGSCVFGLFSDADEAKTAARALSRQGLWVWQGTSA